MKTIPVTNALAAGIGKAAISRFKSAGFYAHTIARVTGLSTGQVQYRIKKYGLSIPRAFALGEDDKARTLIAQAKNLIEQVEKAKEEAGKQAELRRLEREGRHD